jgi:hypothetical protein
VLVGMVLFTLPHIPMRLAMMDNMTIGWGDIYNVGGYGNS